MLAIFRKTDETAWPFIRTRLYHTARKKGHRRQMASRPPNWAAPVSVRIRARSASECVTYVGHTRLRFVLVFPNLSAEVALSNKGETFVRPLGFHCLS